MERLNQIKRLMLRRSYVFTHKATAEAQRSGLTELDVIESVLNSTHLRAKRSTSQNRGARREMVYILQGFTFDGVLVYTKGVIRREDGRDVFYVFVSAKRSTLGGAE